MRQRPQRSSRLAAINNVELILLDGLMICLCQKPHPFLCTEIRGQVSADILAHSSGRGKVSDVATGRVVKIAKSSSSWITEVNNESINGVCNQLHCLSPPNCMQKQLSTLSYSLSSDSGGWGLVVSKTHAGYIILLQYTNLCSPRNGMTSLFQLLIQRAHCFGVSGAVSEDRQETITCMQGCHITFPTV